MRLRPKIVACVGAGPGIADAPYDDPGVWVWGIARHHTFMPRCDLLFEMHDRSIWESYLGQHNYAQTLDSIGPVVMREEHPDIEASIAFPFDIADHWFGGYYTGSPSYMLAYAVTQRVNQIRCYGINCKTRAEYVYQRPNLEFILGVAMGLGIDVFVDKHSALLHRGEPYGTDAWYRAGGDQVEKRYAGEMAGVPA